MKKHWIIPVLVLILLSTACSGGTSGSVSKGGENCSTSPSEGYCEGRYNKVTGTYSMRINQDGLPSSVNVSIQVAVESGQLNIGIETPDGEIVQASASPGTPAQFEATAVVETFMGERGFRVIFETVGESVEGVTYNINYQK